MSLINNSYLVTSAIAALAALTSGSRGRLICWLVVSVASLGIGLLRIAETGLWADEVLRRALYATGSYGFRRPLQIVCMAVFALSLFAVLRRLPYTAGPPVTVALIASYLLTVLMALRGSSLHWADLAFQKTIATVTLSHLMQVLLLLIISGAALFDIHRRRHGRA